MVGNFEEAINCWRRDASLWKHDNEGVILAAAAGAVGVQPRRRLGAGLTPDRAKTFDSRRRARIGRRPKARRRARRRSSGHLRSVVGLVWRSVVLWMLLLALLSLANLIGLGARLELVEDLAVDPVARLR